jgi:hypothetical protein
MELELPKRVPDITRQQLREVQSLEFMKWLSCFSMTHGVRRHACQEYLQAFPKSYGVALVTKELELLAPGVELNTRALAAPATTLATPWAGALTGVEQLAAGFLAQVHSASLLGRIPNLRRVPFNVRVPTEDAGANYQWTGEGSSKPVSAMAFNIAATLTRLKATAIVVFTAELIKAINDATAETLRNTLRDGLVAFTDKAFLDPTSTAIATVRPASITAGRTPVTPGANFASSIQALMNAFFSARPGAVEPVLIAAPQKAAEIRSLNNGGGVGVPIITTAAAGTSVVMLDGAGAFYADDGVEIDVSDEAAFEMNDAPTSPPTASVVIRSMWQDNLRAFRIERFINWHATTTAVQYLA